MWTLLWAVAIAPPADDGPRTPATLGPIDLDGDRLRDAVRQTDVGVVVGKTTVPCGTVAEPCEVEVHDILMVDRTRELLLCQPDAGSRSCRLFHMRDKRLLELKLVVSPQMRVQYPSGRLRAPSISTKGDGHLVAHMPGGLCPHDERFKWMDSRLVHEPVDAYSCAGVRRWVPADTLLGAEPGGPGGQRVDGLVQAIVERESATHPGQVWVVLPDARAGWVAAEQLQTSREE